MKRLLMVLCCVCSFVAASAQGYNYEKTALTNFLIRMYRNAPFEGVRVVSDYDHSYLLSALTLDPNKYEDESKMNRVASVKAMSQANRFFNGSVITDDMVLKVVPEPQQDTKQVIELINDNALGYVKALELLTTFPDDNNRQVFMFYKLIQ